MSVRVQKVTLGKPETITPMCFKQPSDVEYVAQTRYIQDTIVGRKTARGFRVELPLTGDEEIFGLGLQLKNVRHKGSSRTMRINADPIAPSGDSHAPVPFFVSTLGYGVYVDTARYVTFTCGASRKHRRATVSGNSVATTTQELYEEGSAEEKCVMLIDIPAASGVDLYIFEGKTITDVVAEYNMFSGGGCKAPMWGLGVFYRCYARYTDREVVEKARLLREQRIPCDIIGLEPGWQSASYSCSFSWSPDRFPNYMEMIKEVRELGYHLNLWEHAFTASSSPIYDALLEHSGDFEVWKGIVPDFADPEGIRIFSEYHNKELASKGIDGFKLDECDSSDYTGGWSFPNAAEFPSGMDGEQMHCLFGILYQQAILKALDGRPTLSEARSSGALAAPYPFALYSDLYDHRDFVRGLCSAGLSGLLWTPEVRGVDTKEELIRRLQTVVFSPQCLVNAWMIPESPWVQFGAEDEVRELFELRMKLLPYLYTAFERYHCQGVAPVRPLVSDYTDDAEVYAIDDEYLFGDSMLVAPISAPDKCRKVYLPAGRWHNFFSDEVLESGWHEVESENIPVYVKDGSMIALAKPVLHVADDTVFELTIHSWGGNRADLADEEGMLTISADGVLSRKSKRYIVTGFAQDINRL